MVVERSPADNLVIFYCLHGEWNGHEKWMVIRNILTLFQKSIRYSHHKENFLRTLQEGISPVRLKLKKKPALVAISEEFWCSFWMWNSGKVNAKLEKDMDDYLKKTIQIVSERNVYKFKRNNGILQGN